MHIKNIDLIVHAKLSAAHSLKSQQKTGADNGLILSNIVKISEYIKKGNKLQLWIRTPIIPGVTDKVDIITEISEFIKNKMSCGTVARWEMCAFNNSCSRKYQKLEQKWCFADSGLILRKTMNRLKKAAEKSGVTEVVCSGICRD